MSQELNHIRRVETAQEFKKRLAKTLKIGQEYRMIDFEKKHVGKYEKMIKYLEGEKRVAKREFNRDPEVIKLQDSIEHSKFLVKKREANLPKLEKKLRIAKNREYINHSEIRNYENDITRLNANILAEKKLIALNKKELKVKYKKIDLIDKKIQAERKELNKLNKKQEKLGVYIPNYGVEASQFEGKGYYAVCIDRKHVKIIKVDKIEDFSDSYNINLDKVISFKRVEMKVGNAWEEAVNISREAKISVGELFAMAETKVSVGNKFVQNETTAKASAKLNASIKDGIKLNANAKLANETNLSITDGIGVKIDSFIEAYADIAVSATEILAEIGANSEAEIAINLGEFVTFSSKVYFNAKGGVYVSVLGAKAAAEAEVGAEIAFVRRLPKVDEFQLEFASKLVPYGKAEAKAGIGLIKEADSNIKGDEDKLFALGAKAGVAVGVKVILGGTLKYDDEDAASLEGEVDFAFELASVGAFAGFKFSAPDVLLDEAFNDLSFSMGVDLSGALEIGLKIGGTITLTLSKSHIKLFTTEIRNGIKEELKKIITKIASEEVYKQYKIIHQELTHYKKQVLELGKQLKSNTYNALYKGLIKLQTTPKKAVDLEISRHQNKLKTYKAQVENLIAALEAKALKDLNKENLSEEDEAKIAQTIQDIINEEVKAKDLNTLLSSRSRQDLGADLQKYFHKYTERIIKFNEYINKDYIKYAKEIEKHYVKAVAIIEKFNAQLGKDNVSAKDKKKVQDRINTEIKILNQLMDIFNTLVKTKENLMANIQVLDEDGKELPGIDSSSVSKEINSFYMYLRDHVGLLMDKIDDLRDDLK